MQCVPLAHSSPMATHIALTSALITARPHLCVQWTGGGDQDDAKGQCTGRECTGKLL